MTVSTNLLGVFLKGVAASRPAANDVAGGTIYSATDTGAITQSDGTSWSTYATISSGMADPMTTRGDLIIRNSSNATARLGRGTAGQVLASDGTDIAWATPSTAPTIIRGTVNGDGTTAVGTGFSAARNSLGTYTVTFTSAFGATPIAVVTLTTPDPGPNITLYYTTSTTALGISIVQPGVVLVDHQFSFIAMAA